MDVKPGQVEWVEFIRENPGFADPESEERQVGDQLYFKQFAGKVRAGEISYRDALKETANAVSRQLHEQMVDERRRTIAGMDRCRPR